MNEKGLGGSGKKLLYVPIVHTLADMGTLGPSVRRAKLAAFGRQGVARATAKVEKLWEDIERVAGNLAITPGKVRLYQDGLPVCGREREIVAELAGAGSRNHRLLLKLQARGAILMGTESPELLVEEHQLATAALRAETNAGPESNPGPHSNVAPDRNGHADLLERRDRYIAGRINQTLATGETGILFIGLLHNVPRYLNSDVAVYSLGAPPPMK